MYHCGPYSCTPSLFPARSVATFEQRAPFRERGVLALGRRFEPRDRRHRSCPRSRCDTAREQRFAVRELDERDLRRR